MHLSDIVPNFTSENEQFECKLKLNDDKPINWLKTVTGYANSKGGIIFVGVRPEDYVLNGFDQNELDKQKILFYQNIKNHVPVEINLKIDTIPYIINNRNLNILKITIFESHMKPVVLMMNNMPLIYVRKDGFTSPATIEEIRRMTLTSKEVNFDNQKTDIVFDIDNFKKLDAFFYERTNEHLNAKHLAAFGFYDNDLYLKKGAYLFQDDCSFENTRVVCSTYASKTRGADTIINSNSFMGNLIDAYYFINEFIKMRMNHTIIKKSSSHIDVYAFPERALFEAIINSLAHRDYFISGSQISVDLFPNRLVITSPGALYGVGDLAPTYELSSFLSIRRNPLIANTFLYCKAMEAKGTGFEKIEDCYKNYDATHRPYIFSKNNQFSIVLPDMTNNDGIDILEESINIKKTIENETKYDISLLALCFNEKTINEIAKYLGIANSTYLRKSIIGNLKNQNFLIENKIGNAKTYKTNTTLVTLK